MNILNYELLEYEFVEIIYFLIIKKLPSHKETEENKRKYQEYLDTIVEAMPKKAEAAQKEKEYRDETRYLKSRKS